MTWLHWAMRSSLGAARSLVRSSVLPLAWSPLEPDEQLAPATAMQAAPAAAEPATRRNCRLSSRSPTAPPSPGSSQSRRVMVTGGERSRLRKAARCDTGGVTVVTPGSPAGGGDVPVNASRFASLGSLAQLLGPPGPAPHVQLGELFSSP